MLRCRARLTAMSHNHFGSRGVEVAASRVLVAFRSSGGSASPPHRRPAPRCRRICREAPQPLARCPQTERALSTHLVKIIYRCHHPLNSNIISRANPVQTTLKRGLWAAAGDVGHCLSLVRRTPVCCHKALLYAAACALALARPEALHQ